MLRRTFLHVWRGFRHLRPPAPRRVEAADRGGSAGPARRTPGQPSKQTTPLLAPDQSAQGVVVRRVLALLADGAGGLTQTDSDRFEKVADDAPHAAAELV